MKRRERNDPRLPYHCSEKINPLDRFKCATNVLSYKSSWHSRCLDALCLFPSGFGIFLTRFLREGFTVSGLYNVDNEHAASGGIWWKKCVRFI